MVKEEIDKQLQAGVIQGFEYSVKVYGDSSLIINKVQGNWKIRNETLSLYQECIDKIIDEYFDHIEFIHIFRDDNQFADALSKLAFLINIPNELQTMPIVVEQS